jgi:hypothetical protein
MGWFLLTVVLPVIAPIGGLIVFWLLPLPAAVKSALKLVIPFKDGQLCWASMGFCVAGLYELAEPAPGARPLDHAVTNWSNAGLILLLVFSALLAAGGAAFPTPYPPPAGVKPSAHYATMLASFLLITLAGVAYTVVHFQLNP